MSESTGDQGNKSPANKTLDAIEECELSIEKLVAGGDGLGRFEGVPIFVPRSAPGDRVRVKLTDRRAHYARAEIVELLEAGPGRRQPPCEYFDRCGGCDLQHLEDDLQVELKVTAAKESLVRLGGLDLPDSQRVVAGDSWAYRLRTQLQVEPAEEAARVGYFERGTHALVEVERCPVLVPELEAILPHLPKHLAGSAPRRLDVAAGRDGLSTAPVVEGLPHGELEIQVGEFQYAFDARTFFQGHRGLLPELLSVVVGESPNEATESDGVAVDLFAGVGLFTLPLARRHGRVVAVEGDRVAARYLRKNLRKQAAPNVEVQNRAVESWISELPAGAAHVVVDPPRIGLTAGIRQGLRDKAPARITYASCHPAALARDLKILCRDYRLEELIFLDLFPQTAHIEVVARLGR